MDELDPNEYKIGKPERLFQLTALLLSSPRALTKSEILTAVPAYASEYVEGGNNSSLERKFERDKEELRRNGIQIDLVIPKHEDENNQVSMYVIKADNFYWPRDIQLTPRQLGLLNLAAQAWAGGSLAGAASKGITKLRAMGVVGGDSDIIGIAPRIATSEPNFRELNNAISDQRIIEFDYRNPKTGEILRRTLHPWLLRRVAGQWLVLGYDELRDDTRNFMLRRMVSKVSSSNTRSEYIAGTPEAIEKAVKDLEDLAANQIAVLKVKPDSEAWFRYAQNISTDSSSKLELHYHDIYVLAEELREYAGQVEVVKPQALADLVKAGFEKVADMHA